jgi:WD40 repeat protein
MSDQPVATHIFISHSSTDAAFVQRLSADLQQVGVPIWVDHQKLKAGTRNWEKAIRDALKRSRALIYVASSAAAQSDYVQDELSIAEMEGCALLASWAVGEDGRWLDNTPLGYGKLQYTDMRGEKYEAGLKELIEALNNIPQRPLSPTAIMQAPFATPIVTPARRQDEAIAEVRTAPPETHDTTLPGAPRNPYKALDAFTETDRGDFFGRDTLIAALYERLRDFPQFLAVLGASGSGKSSVVMAGLIPDLRHKHPDWIILPPIKPGAHPVESLAIMLHAAYFAQGSVKAVREDLEVADARGLAIRAGGIPRAPKARIVLVIDQFEEIFTQTVSDAEREQFIGLLTSVTSDPDSRVTIIVTLRADFFDRILSNSDLGRLIKSHNESVLPMSITDLKQTIECPAERVGLHFEDGLVADLVFDSREQVGALPLLQFTLDQLYQRRNGQTLTNAAYRAIGGVKGALAKHAEQVYTSLPSDEHRHLARALFLRLIEPGTTEQDTTRRRAAWNELILSDPAQTTIMQVCANRFIGARLLTTNRVGDAVTLEVAHEALIREWTRLSDWLKSARDDVGLQKQIAQDTAAWTGRGKTLDDDGLYRGYVLMNAEEWAKRNVPSAYEMAFLQVSAARQQEMIAQEERRKAELHQAEESAYRAQQNAERAGRWARRIAFIAVVVVIAIAVVVGLIANQSVTQANQTLTPIPQTISAAQSTAHSADQKVANAGTQVALAGATLTPIPPTLTAAATQLQGRSAIIESQRLAAQANIVLQQSNGKPEVAVLLGIRALRTGYTDQADSTLLQALSRLSGEKVLTGHSNLVVSVAFSPDGKTILTGSTDETARLWDAVTGQTLFTLTGHSGWVNSVAFSPDGKLVATGSDDKTVRLWDATNGQLLTTLSGFTDGVGSVAFSPDSKTVLTGSNDKTARLWDTTSGKQLQSLPHSYEVQTVAFAPNGKTFFTSDLDTVKIWDASTFKLLKTTDKYPSYIVSMAVSPDGKTLLIGGGDNNAALWDVATGQTLFTFTGHKGIVGSVAFSPDGQTVVTGSDDKTARLWDAASGQLIQTLTGHLDSVRGVAFSPDGKTVLTGSFDTTARLWDASTTQHFLRLRAQGSTVTSVAFSPDGKLTLSAGPSEARLSDAATGRILRTLSGITGTIESAVFSPDGATVLTGGCADSSSTCGHGEARLWDVATGQTLRIFAGHSGSVVGVAFAPDGKTILTASEDTTARVWDANSGQILLTLAGHGDAVNGIAIAPDGKTIVTGSSDNTARLWDATTGQARLTLAHTDSVNDVAFSPDGKLVLTASKDKTARLWDAATGKPLQTLTGHADSVNVAVFSPDGRTVLTGSDDTTARLWDVATGQVVEIFREHTDHVTSVAFSPDGKTVLTGSDDTTTRLWDSDYRNFIAYACTRVSADFSANDRLKFDLHDSEPTCPQFASADQPLQTALPPTTTPLAVTLPVWTPLPTLTPTQTFTPSITPTPSATATATQTATPIPAGQIAALDRTARLVAGPLSGELKHNADSNNIVSQGAGVNLKDFIAEARFFNPFDPAKAGQDWSYGLEFRTQGYNQQYRLIIGSGKTWVFKYGPNGSAIGSGSLPDLDITEAGSLLLTVKVKNNQAEIFINDQSVGTFDVSAHPNASDVYIGTGLYSGSMVNGAVTRYGDFRVWSLEPPPTATPTPLPAGQLAALEPTAQIVYGPISGDLKHINGNLRIVTNSAGVTLRDFIAEAHFHNPYDGSTNGKSWSYGVFFRDQGGSNQYRFAISSGQSWELSYGTTPLDNGPLPGLDVSADGETLIAIKVKDNQAQIFVNGELIGTFNLSDHPDAGDIGVATGLYLNTMVAGAVTHYADFTIWSLEPPESPTPSDTP